jgi:Lysylphosphatidylglycerol synthase TM region
MLRRGGQFAAVIAGAAALALIVRLIGVATIAGLLRQVGWWFWLSVLIYAGNIALRGLALWRVLPAGAIPLRHVIAIRFGVEGVEMLTLTGPFVAEPAKAWLLHRQGLDGPEAVGAVAAEYLIYDLVAAWMAAAALSVLLLRGALPHALRVPAVGMLAAVAVLTLGCVIAAVTGKGLVVPVARTLARLVGRAHEAAAVLARVDEAERVLVSVLHDDPRRLAAVLAAELAAHGLLVVEIMLLLGALGLLAGLGTAFVLEGAVKCIGALFFFVPGQLGVSEGIYALLLPLVGLPAAAGVTIILLRRARALAVGAAGFLFFARPAGRRTS